jgi:hypothetical protein
MSVCARCGEPLDYEDEDTEAADVYLGRWCRTCEEKGDDND